MKTIRVPCYQIVIKVDKETPGNGTISSSLKDGAKDTFYNAAVDALLSIILAHACAGVDVQSPAYVEGIETACDDIGNRFA